jgi:hypothetical protein
MTVPRKSRWNLVPAVVLAVLAVALVLGAPGLTGIRAVDWNAARVHLRIRCASRDLSGLPNDRAFDGIDGYRRSSIARTDPLNPAEFKAVVEFEAESLTDATTRLDAWRKQTDPALQIEIEKLIFQPLLLYRPGRGDVHFGPPQMLTGTELEAIRTSPAPGAGTGMSADRRQPGQSKLEIPQQP